MAFPDVFRPEVTAVLLKRLEALHPGAQPAWGRMAPSHMLTHCCLIYDQLEGRVGDGPWLLRTLGRLFFKQTAVGAEPFKHNIPTPKAFRVVDGGDFEGEKARLRELVVRIHGLGATAFDGRRHGSFGVLRAEEWSNLMYKHLDHHFRQFGV